LTLIPDLGEVERLFQRYFLQTSDLSEVLWQKPFQSGWIVTTKEITRRNYFLRKLLFKNYPQENNPQENYPFKKPPLQKNSPPRLHRKK